tara:strand:+ start:95 stop:412 length:318 start_codon:yes stop_codon:yes gene_type:complete
VNLGESDTGTTLYVDIDSIKKHNGYIYYWGLRDLLKPDKWGDMSLKLYFQGDCGVIRMKYLSYNYYKKPMGRGESEVDNTESEWKYPPPDTVDGKVLDYVCDYVD